MASREAEALTFVTTRDNSDYWKLGGFTLENAVAGVGTGAAYYVIEYWTGSIWQSVNYMNTEVAGSILPRAKDIFAYVESFQLITVNRRLRYVGVLIAWV